MTGGWRAPLAQTAHNDATQIVAAMVQAGTLDGDIGANLDVLDQIADHIFARLDVVKQADDVAYEADQASAPAAKSSSRSSARSGKTFGGRGKGKKVWTLEDARNMELNFGSFKGVTLGDLVNIRSDEASNDYGYGDGDKDGQDYLRWLTNADNEFARDAARLVAEDEGISFERK